MNASRINMVIDLERKGRSTAENRNTAKNRRGHAGQEVKFAFLIIVVSADSHSSQKHIKSPHKRFCYRYFSLTIFINIMAVSVIQVRFIHIAMQYELLRLRLW